MRKFVAALVILWTLPNKTAAQDNQTSPNLIGAWRDKGGTFTLFPNKELYIKWNDGTQAMGVWAYTEAGWTQFQLCFIQSGQLSTLKFEEASEVKGSTIAIESITPTSLRYQYGETVEDATKLPQSLKQPEPGPGLRNACAPVIARFYKALADQEAKKENALVSARRAEEAAILSGITSLERIADVWNRPETSKALKQCVITENSAILREVQIEEAESKAKFTSKARIDSALNAANAKKTMAPLWARYRCHGRWGTSLGYYILKNVDSKEFTEKANVDAENSANGVSPSSARAYWKSQIDDFTTEVWRAVNVGLRATNTEEYLRTGPWALSQSTIDALSKCRGNCDELEGQFASAGAKMAIDLFTVNPYRNGYATLVNQVESLMNSAVNWTQKPKSFWSDSLLLAIYSVDSISYSPNQKILNQYRDALFSAIASLGCTWPDRELGDAWSIARVCPVRAQTGASQTGVREQTNSSLLHEEPPKR
jgi:hypothetical protein